MSPGRRGQRSQRLFGAGHGMMVNHGRMKMMHDGEARSSCSHQTPRVGRGGAITELNGLGGRNGKDVVCMYVCITIMGDP